MARQTGPVIWEMTINGISFYKRCGQGCVRMKSNLTGKRWKSDPAFAGSRISAANMAQASAMASTYYRTIPLHQRLYRFYLRLVGIGQEMLSAGFSIEQVGKVMDFTVGKFLRKLETMEARANGNPIRSSFATRKTFKPNHLLGSTVLVTANLEPLTKLHEQIFIRRSQRRMLLPYLIALPRGRPPKAVYSEESSLLVRASSATPVAGHLMPMPQICRLLVPQTTCSTP